MSQKLIKMGNAIKQCFGKGNGDYDTSYSQSLDNLKEKNELSNDKTTVSRQTGRHATFATHHSSLHETQKQKDRSNDKTTVSRLTGRAAHGTTA